jgi:hypothetical protein
MRLVRKRRTAVLIALSIAFAVAGVAGTKKSRVFNARFDVIWVAAVDAAKDGFLLDKASKEQGKLRFRTGPFRRYRFEVSVIEVGTGRTRVEVELRTNFSAIEKDAWRSGDHYLDLLSQRLKGSAAK